MSEATTVASLVGPLSDAADRMFVAADFDYLVVGAPAWVDTVWHGSPPKCYFAATIARFVTLMAKREAWREKLAGVRKQGGTFTAEQRRKIDETEAAVEKATTTLRLMKAALRETEELTADKIAATAADAMREPASVFDLWELQPVVVEEVKPATATEWQTDEAGELLALAERLGPTGVPKRFSLASWHTVTDGQRWLAGLLASARLGRAGQKTRGGVLPRLRRLRDEPPQEL